MIIKTAWERLKEFTLDTHNAPVSLVVGCQNAEIIELRLELARQIDSNRAFKIVNQELSAELDKLKNQDPNTDLLTAFDMYARQFTYNNNHSAAPSHFPTGFRWFKAGYLAQQEGRK